MSYYYFAATLPMLMIDQAPPFTVEEFRQQCATHLAPWDMAAMQELLDNRSTPSSHPFTRRWRMMDGRLRNALARTRAERMNRNPADYTHDIPGFDASLEQEVADAYNRPTPLEREKAIDHIRWRRLEAMAGIDPFTSEALLAYGLQLAMLERWARIDKETGASTVEALVNRHPADEEERS